MREDCYRCAVVTRRTRVECRSDTARKNGRPGR